MPPSPAGSNWGVSTRRPARRNPLTVASSSRRLANTPPERTTSPRPCSDAARLHAVTVAFASDAWKRAAIAPIGRPRLTSASTAPISSRASIRSSPSSDIRTDTS
jgi:hypothetical protein